MVIDSSVVIDSSIILSEVSLPSISRDCSLIFFSNLIVHKYKPKTRDSPPSSALDSLHHHAEPDQDFSQISPPIIKPALPFCAVVSIIKTGFFAE